MIEQGSTRDCIGCRHHKLAPVYNPAAMTLFFVHKCTYEGSMEAPAAQWHGLTFNLKAPAAGTCKHKPRRR